MPAPGKALTAVAYVDTPEGLGRLAQRLLGERVIAVDTESNSLFAYRERVCLIQISSAHGDFLVDPLAIGDLAPLAPVFAEVGIVKVFHDAEYDILALKRAHPFEFASVFDTKVAAMSLGRQSLGLAAALSEHFGVQIDKRLQRSDWGARPLTEEQKQYARLDTHYLIELGQRLRVQLVEAGAIHLLEVASECRRLAGLVPVPRSFDPDAFASLRGAETLDPSGRRRLRELFSMRERIAADRDLPPFKVLHSDMLVEIARRAPSSSADLTGIPGFFPKLIERFGGAVMSALRRAERLRPINDLPRGDGDGALRLSPAQRRAYDRLRAWRKSAAASRRIEASLVLPRGVLEALATLRPRPRDADGLLASGLLEPWRVVHYGDGILAALA